MKKVLAILLVLFFTPALISFDTYNHYDSYIEKYLPIAERYESECGIPVSIQIAQAIAESGGGKSNIGKVANNHFGIMAFSNWRGKVYKSTSGNWRKYDSVEDSYSDHAEFLYEHYQHAVGKPASYWIKNCGGYGSKGYWLKLNKVILMYDLYKYDKISIEYDIENWFYWRKG
jgi:flagellum-specific peptidoglycan hydrolase FlgJ